jgi:AAA domain
MAGDLPPDALAWDGLHVAPTIAELEAEARAAAGADPIARHELAYLSPDLIAAAAATRANLAAQEAEATRPLTPTEAAQAYEIAKAEADRLGYPTVAAYLEATDPMPGRRTDAPALIVGIDAYRASVPAAIPWVCRPLAYLGGVSLIAGPPKAGKSTLAAQLQRCRETGERLFGAWEVTTGPTLLVTEEGGVAVVHKAEGLHALDVLDRRSAVRAELTFRQMLGVVSEWAAAHPGGLVFIDTLAIWAGIADENDAGQATRAIAAVTATAQAADLAIVLVHHARKAAGTDGEAIRGSGAILATVDVGIELSRVGPGRDDRYLDIMGRIIQAERYELAFDRSTSAYTLADQSGARLAAIEADLEGIPPAGPGLTRPELQALWKRDPRSRADQLVNVGRMRAEYVKSGRAFAWRYWSIPPAWTPEARHDD